jgi:two-component system chemotaxis response regulator CheB
MTCPACGGTLWEREEGDLVRFECRVGHAYSPASLLSGQLESLEGALWAAVVALEERADMTRRMARRVYDRSQPGIGRRWERLADDALRRAELVRKAIVLLEPDDRALETGAKG